MRNTGSRTGKRTPGWVSCAAAVCLLWLPRVQADPLTVVGFNVDSGDASDQVIALQLKQSRGIDVWGLGDVWPDGGWVETMHEAAQEAEDLEYGVLVGETGGSARLMLLYRSDRLELLGHEELLAARGGKRQAAPLVARMRLAGKTEFLLVLVQLSDGARSRAGQTAALEDWARRQGLPVVAFGTFSFGLAETQGPDEDMQQFLDASGWQWLRPRADVATTCDRGGRIDDFVLVGGAATTWSGLSEVMFPQSNYCPDSGRTSGHRPVQARFSTGVGALDTQVGMAERQALPLLPGEVETATDEWSDSDAEIESLRRRVEELEASKQVAQSPPAGGTAEPPAPPATEAVPETEPTLQSGAPEVVDQDALRRRLEELEREVQELRKLLEDSGG